MSISFKATEPKTLESWPDVQRPLPPFVRQYCESGAAEGERNSTIFKVAQQFYACGYSTSEAESFIMPRAVAQGGERVRREVLTAIQSAFKSSSVTQPLTKRPEAVKKATGTPGTSDFIQAIQAAFEPHEVVAVVDCYKRDDGEWKPGKATMKTRAEWERWHTKSGDIGKLVGRTPGGAFMGINPFKPGSENRSNDNVSAFRHVLVEWDGPADGSGKPDQRARIEASGLPVSVLVDSGKKSIHAWVRVDAQTREEWEQRRDTIFKDLQCDEKNRDLARVSRCPGAIRLVDDQPRVQKLLAVKIGAKSWGQWETRKVGLPPITSFKDLIVANHQPTPEVIKGVLNMGCKMLVAGPSKARKSWVLLDLCCAVALGRPWLGFDTTEGKVLFVNFELTEWMLTERLGKIIQSRGMMQLGTRGDWLQFWNLRGRIHDMAALTAPLIDAVKGGGFSLIVIDPAYKGMGDRDENSAGDINKLLNELEKVCGETGVALAFAHHFAKGNSSEKAAIDRMSGSGVWARDPDAVLTLTPPSPIKVGKGRDAEYREPEHDLDLECALRAHPPVEASALYWKAAHFERQASQRYVISSHKEGSYADKFGPLVKTMPPLTRLAAEEWLRINAEIEIEEARKAFAALKRPEYGLMTFDNVTKEWVGTEASPF